MFPLYSHRHGNPKVTGTLASRGRLCDRAGNPKMEIPAKGCVQDQGVRNVKKQVWGGVYIDARNERRRGGKSGMGAPKNGKKAFGEALWFRIERGYGAIEPDRKPVFQIHPRVRCHRQVESDVQCEVFFYHCINNHLNKGVFVKYASASMDFPQDLEDFFEQFIAEFVEYKKEEAVKRPEIKR